MFTAAYTYTCTQTYIQIHKYTGKNVKWGFILTHQGVITAMLSKTKKI